MQNPINTVACSNVQAYLTSHLLRMIQEQK